MDSVNKKNIPLNIKKAINIWINENKVNKLKTIKLNKYEDFDVIKHKDFLIKFSQGGKVGDKLWNLQYIHNLNILLNNNKNITWAPETYIKLNHDELPKISSINIYINDFLFDEISSEMIYCSQNMYDITPLTYNENKHLYDKNKMVFLNLYTNYDNIIRKIIYKNKSVKFIKNDDIYFLKY